MDNLSIEYWYIGEAILFQYPVWKIFKRVGIFPWFSLIVLVPGMGIVFCALIVALSKWQVQLQSEA
ncbi:MAG: hypothetical protein GY694_22980 [Gammaproteobacteria bacterium]|nr:hypothetical protein [Gammaproteobacteria bacterium]